MNGASSRHGGIRGVVNNMDLREIRIYASNDHLFLCWNLGLGQGVSGVLRRLVVDASTRRLMWVLVGRLQ